MITQNVDGLHAAAGTRELVEVHGAIAQARCPSCDTLLPRKEVRELLPVPACPHCGDVLKPDVVMFGELLPVAAMERALALVDEARLVLVVGSSLEVWPVAGLPDRALAHGAKLAIVNRDQTPYDGVAQLVVRASAGETLAAALRAV